MTRRLSRRGFLGQAVGTVACVQTAIRGLSFAWAGQEALASTAAAVGSSIQEKACLPKTADELEPMLWRVCAPPKGSIYHGVYPGHTIDPLGCPAPDDESGAEDKLTEPDLKSYTSLKHGVGKDVAWVYFSNEWGTDKNFPAETAKWIRRAGSVPFIRLMLRTTSAQEECANKKAKEEIYTLRKINNGCFDEQLRAWGVEARKFGTPLIVEWGTEANGCWFHWNGKWNGAAADKESGPAMFRRAFRRIVRLIRDEADARNITWVFHATSAGDPDYRTAGNEWNRMMNYYPGDEYIDWIGLSVYGAQKPEPGQECPSFCSQMENALQELGDDKNRKPLFILEFGATGGFGDSTTPADKCEFQQCGAAAWADDALGKLLGHRWPEVRGFSWWNESWLDKGDTHKKTTYKVDMRVQCVPKMKEVFQKHLNSSAGLLTRPLYQEMDLQVAPVTKKMKLLIPAYFYPEGAGATLWERLIKVGETEQVVAIANPNSGPGTDVDINYEKYIQRASAYGVTIVGYIATGYGKVPASKIKSQIKKWLDMYPSIRGFFFDEQEWREKNEQGVDMIAHYSKVFADARKELSKKECQSLIISNPGMICSERYLTEAKPDVLCLYESSDKPEPEDGKRFSSFEPTWMKKYPAESFAALVLQVDSQDKMKQYVQLAASKGFGYVFVTNHSARDPGGDYCKSCQNQGTLKSQCEADCNPWNKLPPEDYWKDELESIGASK